jgi:hypothetical protein
VAGNPHCFCWVALAVAGTSNAGAAAGGNVIAQGGSADGLSGSISIVVGSSTTTDGPRLSLAAGGALAASRTGGSVVLQGGDASTGTSSTGGSVAVTGGVGQVSGGHIVLSTSTSTTSVSGSSGAVRALRFAKLLSVLALLAWLVPSSRETLCPSCARHRCPSQRLGPPGRRAAFRWPQEYPPR